MDAWMRKKTMAGLLALALTVSPFVGAVSQASAATAATASFTDVEKSYAKTEIEELVKLGILSGDGAGQFNPTAGSTRAEMAKVLTLALGLKPNPEAAAPFKDIPANAWYKGYVGAMVASGITKGTSATSFSPNEQVSREALAVFYIRAMGLEESAQALQGEAAFADAGKISSWALPAVRLAAKLGFIQGVEKDGNLYFEPAAKAERQALAKLTYSFYVNKEEYVEQAAKIVKEEGNPSAWPSVAPTPSATPTPTPVSGGGGGGYIPPVATPTPTSGSTPTSTPTDSTNPTPAPTMGEGDPSVSKPYFAYKYSAQSSTVYGVTDGRATVRVYYKGGLVGETTSSYEGNYFVSLFGNEEKLTEGFLQITSQRAGENESQPLHVPIRPAAGSTGEGEVTQTPKVNDIHAGDLAITGQTLPYANIIVKNAEGHFVGGAYSDKEGKFLVGMHGVLEGDVYHVTARKNSQPISEAAKMEVGPKYDEKTASVKLENATHPAGPFMWSSSEALGTIFRIKAGNRILFYQQKSLIQYEFQPDASLKAGEKVEIEAQYPGKAPSDVTQVGITVPDQKTSVPKAGTLYYNSNSLSVEAEASVWLYVKDAEGSMASAVSYPTGQTQRKLSLYSTEPGETYYLYAFVPGKAESEAVPIIIPKVESRATQPTVTGTVYEGSSEFYVVSEKGTQIRAYWITPQSEAQDEYSYRTYSSDGGRTQLFFERPLLAGEKFLIQTVKEGAEISKATLITVQEVSETAPLSEAPRVIEAVYEGDYLISVGNMNLYNFFLVQDDKGNTLDSGRYPILKSPIPKGTKSITIYAQEPGKKKNKIQVPVNPVTGVTEGISIETTKFVVGRNTLKLTAHEGDKVFVFWKNNLTSIFTSYTANYNYQFDLAFAIPGDTVTILVVTPGKEAFRQTFVIQSP